MKKIVHDYKDDIIHLYVQEQRSVRQISEQLGLRISSVSGLLKKTVGLRKRGASYDKKQKILQLHQQGYSNREIGNIIELDPTNVRRILFKEFGIKPQKPNRKSKFEEIGHLLANDYKQGLSSDQISKKYRVSKNTVLDYVRKHDLKVRTYLEANANTGINKSYFNELTPTKIQKLGMIWGCGTITNTINLQTLELVSNKKHVYLLEDLTNGWIDLNSTSITQAKSTNHCQIRFSASDIIPLFQKWGFRETYPNCITPMNDDFWKGFLLIKTRLNANCIRISTKSMPPHFEKQLCEYLTSKGIKEKSLCYNRKSFIIRSKKETINLLNTFPFLYEKMKKHKIENDHWNAIFKQI